MTIFLVCPYCGKKSDQQAPVARAGSTPSTTPSTDRKQVSMCIACGGMAVAEPSLVGLALRLPRPEEIADIDEDPMFTDMRDAYRDAFHREPAPWPQP